MIITKSYSLFFHDPIGRIHSVFIFTGKIDAHFRCFHVFVTRCTTVITTGQGFFDMFVVNRDVVITNGTNRIGIVPKASGTLNHRSYGHIPILTMMTWVRGLLLNDSLLVRLANTFRIITFRLTLLRSLHKPFLFLVNHSKSSCFLLNACQLLTVPDHPGRY